MDAEFVLVFVFIFLSDLFLLTFSIGIRVGNFRVLREQNQLKKCADEVLRHNEYVGARISEQTGVCEGLSHSWGRNQTIEDGYGYITKMSVEETFEPPAPLVPSHEVWTTFIPGVFSTGARIDFHITGMIEGSSNILTFLLEEGLKGHRGHISIDDFGDKIIFGGFGAPRNYASFPDAFIKSTEWKFSFVAQNNYLQVLLDDREIKTMEVKKGHLYDITHIQVYNSNVYMGKPISIRRFEFSEA